MERVQKTLYIPLYGKAYVSKKGIILYDAKAEEIWTAEEYPIKGKSASKWLAYYMGMRAAVFDCWVQEQMASIPEAVVIHLGCGMDSRAERVGRDGHLWLDVDFQEVIDERKRHYRESLNYRMVGCDIRDPQWQKEIPKGGAAIVVMEGVSMYLRPEELEALLLGLKNHFTSVHLLMDCYTTFSAKASKYKNPINEVGVREVYGLDDPAALQALSFVKAHNMTPEDLICQLPKGEQRVFRRLYAGKLAKKMYRLYEYEA